MPHPAASIPARITASAASRPASPQPSDRAASAASRPISADLLLRERVEEPLFSPSGTEGASVPAARRASQIFSFTSMICSTAAVNSACRATSPRTFSTSAAASWRPTVFRRPADRVHRNRGPCPG